MVMEILGEFFSEIGSFYKPVVLMIAFTLVYLFLVFKFSKSLAKREMFAFEFHHHKNEGHSVFKEFVNVFGHFLKYIFVFPFFTFFWVLVLFFVMFFLAKNGNVEYVLMTSVAIVAVIRIAAYYREDYALDLSKLLPFTLFAIFVADFSSFSFKEMVSLLKNFSDFGISIFYYLIFLVFLEMILRFIFLMGKLIYADKKHHR